MIKSRGIQALKNIAVFCKRFLEKNAKLFGEYCISKTEKSAIHLMMVIADILAQTNCPSDRYACPRHCGLHIITSPDSGETDYKTHCSSVCMALQVFIPVFMEWNDKWKIRIPVPAFFTCPIIIDSKFDRQHVF